MVSVSVWDVDGRVLAFPVLGTRPSLWQKKQASGVKVDSLTHQRKCPFAFHDPRLGEIRSNLLDCIPMEQRELSVLQHHIQFQE